MNTRAAPAVTGRFAPGCGSGGLVEVLTGVAGILLACVNSPADAASAPTFTPTIALLKSSLARSSGLLTRTCRPEPATETADRLSLYLVVYFAAAILTPAMDRT